ncbi:MAG: type II secretion system GspH family protein [Candidatus Pacebacteria bacterium]|nr:type II secretion system GspH family protein [Candidatus Paceibacterota bacterium]
MKEIRKQRGFTLIEIMVAVALFAVVMTISIGALLSLVEANRKAQALNSIKDNLNFALENMSRNMRAGTTYHCSTNTLVPSDLDSPEDCASGGVLVAFEKFDGDPADPGDQVVYRFVANRIEKSVDGGSTFIPITASEVVIEDMKFYVVGTTQGDTKQPRIVMTIQGSAGVSARTVTNFNLQSTISQRVLDL